MLVAIFRPIWLNIVEAYPPSQIALHQSAKRVHRPTSKASSRCRRPRIKLYLDYYWIHKSTRIEFKIGSPLSCLGPPLFKQNKTPQNFTTVQILFLREPSSSSRLRGAKLNCSRSSFMARMHLYWLLCVVFVSMQKRYSSYFECQKQCNKLKTNEIFGFSK